VAEKKEKEDGVKSEFGLIPKDGIHSCFCKHEQKSDPKAFEDGKKDFTFLDMHLNKNRTYPVCEKYTKIEGKAEVINLVNSKAIVITNVLIRLFVISVVGRTGFKTDTIMAFYISVGVFVFVFMNTAVLLLLSNANLRS
jgi:hypothetical protein